MAERVEPTPGWEAIEFADGGEGMEGTLLEATQPRVVVHRTVRFGDRALETTVEIEGYDGFHAGYIATQVIGRLDGDDS